AHGLGDPSRQAVSEHVEVDREGAKTPAGHGPPTIVDDRMGKAGLIFKGLFDRGNEPTTHEDASVACSDDLIPLVSATIADPFVDRIAFRRHERPPKQVANPGRPPYSMFGRVAGRSRSLARID